MEQPSVGLLRPEQTTDPFSSANAYHAEMTKWMACYALRPFLIADRSAPAAETDDTWTRLSAFASIRDLVMRIPSAAQDAPTMASLRQLRCRRRMELVVCSKNELSQHRAGLTALYTEVHAQMKEQWPSGLRGWQSRGPDAAWSWISQMGPNELSALVLDHSPPRDDDVCPVVVAAAFLYRVFELDSVDVGRARFWGFLRAPQATSVAGISPTIIAKFCSRGCLVPSLYQGFGRRLLAFCVQHIKHTGATPFLSVSQSPAHRAAQNLYRSIGGTVITTRPPPFHEPAGFPLDIYRF